VRLLLLCLPVLVLSTGCPGPECGAGTHLEDGLCVPDEADTDTDTDPDTDTDTDTDTDLEPEPPVGCPPLAPSFGNEVVIASGDAAGLRTAVDTAQEGDVILLEDGTYHLDGSYLWIDVDDVVLRSISGDRDAVILDGGYQTTEIINLVGSNITVADLTIQRCTSCAMHVQPANGYDTVGHLIYNVAIIDPGEHAIKINQSGGNYTDNGVIACNRMELTDAGRPYVSEIVSGCYTGGVDAHNTRGWHIYDNHIEGFWCETGTPEHGIHMWNGNADTIIERNTIIDVWKGIGLGMNSSGANTRGFEAEYDCVDGSHPDDFNSTVRNNTVLVTGAGIYASAGGFDTGIEIENGCLSRLLHNSVYSSETPYSSMSWRYPGTSGHIANNLLSHNLRERRESGEDPAEIVAEGNLSDLGSAPFADVDGGDLHITEGSSAVDAGVVLSGDSAVTWDIDGDLRDASPDVGADEL
jgi:hypothetical protein